MLPSVIKFINSGMTGHRWLGGVLACKVHYYLHLVKGLIEPEVNRIASGRKTILCTHSVIVTVFSHVCLSLSCAIFRALSPIVPMSISLSHREQRHFYDRP